jgi:hypothetical protein
VNCNSGQSQETVDFTSGTDGWVDLGTFKFAAGSSGYVKAASSGIGIVRANVVKFLRR